MGRSAHDGFDDWPRRPVVVVSAANSWDVDRFADHQLALALAERVPVLYVDPPSSVVGRAREAGRPVLPGWGSLTRVAPRVARLVPEVLPGVSRPAVVPLNARIVAAQVRRSLRTLGATEQRLVEANLLAPVMGRIGAVRSVYWAQDDFIGMAPLVGVPPAVFASADVRLARSADAIVAANPSVADAIRARGHEVRVVPFGCNAELFASTVSATPARDVDLTAPVAFLMGTVNDRLDVALLTAVADRGIPLLLVGPRSARFESAAFDALVARPSVQLIGERAFQDMPSYLAHAGVGLVPYTHSRFNEGSFPLKTLEYLAAGRPVVATDLPAIRWLDSPDVLVADSPGEYAAAVERVLSSYDEDDAARRAALARTHSWASRADEFCALLGLDA